MGSGRHCYSAALRTATALVSQNATLLYVRDALTNEFRHGFEAGTILLIVAALVFGYWRVKDPISGGACVGWYSALSSL